MICVSCSIVWKWENEVSWSDMCPELVSPAGVPFQPICFCRDSHGVWLGRDVGLVAGDTLVTGCVTAEITAILVWNPRAHLRLMFVCLSRKEQCGTTVGHGGVRGLWASSPHPSFWQQRSGLLLPVSPCSWQAFLWDQAGPLLRAPACWHMPHTINISSLFSLPLWSTPQSFW